MSCDDSTTLEDLEESFDDLTVSGKSYFSIAFVVYYRIWITNYSADSQSFKIMFFPFFQRQSNEQLTSTPEKDRSLSARHVKHDLTPKSKCASLPTSKRRQIGVNYVIQIFGENN